MDKILFHAHSHGNYVKASVLCLSVNSHKMLIITLFIQCLLTKYLLFARPYAKHRDIIAKKICIVSQTLPFSGM